MPRNVLLLQGPVGPFFRNFAIQLEQNGHNVLKVNLNGGDLFFYQRGNYINYRNTPAMWPFWIESIITQREIERIYLFGDCRRYHRQAISVAKRLGVDVHVFEEGYVRPNYTTLEKGGVNGYSEACSKDALSSGLDGVKGEECDNVTSAPVKSVFMSAAVSAMKYYLASAVMRGHFPYYEHHRSLKVIPEGLCWIRSGFRKMKYRIVQRRIGSTLINGEIPYFLVPLQVHNDTQVTQHSEFGSVEAFIERVIVSFASAAENTHLVFKHHPYDRGYKCYKKHIQKLVRKHNIEGKVFYIHDVDLPALLRNASGSVLINSTVGISSLYHQTPVKAMGDAIYNLPGLTYQGKLEAFWQNPGEVDNTLFHKFRNYLIAKTQVNGSVYTEVEGDCGASGMIWSDDMFRTHIQATHHNVIDLEERRTSEPTTLDREAEKKLAVQ